MRSLILVAAVLTSLLVTASTSGAAGTKLDPDTVVKCTGAWPFKASLLNGSKNAEKGKSTTAALLRKTLRKSSHRLLPKKGWFITTSEKWIDTRVVQYANGTIDGITTVTFSKTVGKKRWESDVSRGIDCGPPKVTRTGREATAWYPVADDLPINPAARSISVAVNTQGCQPSKELFLDEIKYTKKAVQIRMDLRPHYGGPACPAILRPPTKFVVPLSEPIGNRSIVDTFRTLPRTRASAEQIASVRAGVNPIDVLFQHKVKNAFCNDADPSAYLAFPTEEQLRRWNVRAKGDCAWAVDGVPEYVIWRAG